MKSETEKLQNKKSSPAEAREDSIHNLLYKLSS